MDIKELIQKWQAYQEGSNDYKFPGTDLPRLKDFFQDINDKLLILGTEYRIVCVSLQRDIAQINAIMFARTLP